jgi:hypothetical protein
VRARSPASLRVLLANFAMIAGLADGKENLDMPTRNISLLRQRRRESASRLQALKLQIEAGAAALERGDFIELDDTELELYLDGLATGADDGIP